MPKPVDTVTVADVDIEELVDNSLVVILNLNFGHDIEAEVWARFSTIFLVKISKLNCDQDLKNKYLEAEFW